MDGNRLDLIDQGRRIAILGITLWINCRLNGDAEEQGAAANRRGWRA